MLHLLNDLLGRVTDLSISPALYFFRTLLGVLVDSPQNGIEFCPFSAHQRHWYRGIVKVIGTAGHIDHGKSTLVRRLTGIDPDRLAEEKRRGMTIDLGFAWVCLKSGEVSIVDVPGHERFIKNMLAGAAGIDVALLVVAADEGVMPQTREHLDILELLAVQQGVVAISKSDLVDEDWLDLVTDEIRGLLAGTRLADSEIVRVSATNGRGVAELLEALDAAVLRAPDRGDDGAPFLPIDRVFTVAGFGTVVTGTLHGGSLISGQMVEVLPSGGRARIRSMESHGRTVPTGSPGDRVALNLAGIEHGGITRGDVVSPPSRIRPTRKFDARARVLESSSQPLHHGAEVMLHVGAAERTARVSVLAGGRIDPGKEEWVQVRIRDAVVAVPGQRFILRLPSPARTMAGGEVVDIAPRHRRSDATAMVRLGRMLSGSTEDLVLAALAAPKPRTLSDITLTLGRSESLIQESLKSLTDRRDIVRVGDWFVSWDAWVALGERVRTVAETFHRNFPLRPGIPREEVRSKTGWGPGPWQAALPALVSAGFVRTEGTTVALPTFQSMIGQEGVARAVLDALRSRPYAPPTRKELELASGATPDLFAALSRQERIVRLDDDIYLDRDVFDEMVDGTLSQIRESGAITVSELRDRFGSSRRYALAFLELLDARGITRRDGDRRVLGSRAGACA
ncbi:MAG TPA: selenocysteine-specific translation elongation factor [Chloroflexi bacterium]|nr:selenocysteine-specific translation elongation factor [Chloroflexota bacterium]